MDNWPLHELLMGLRDPHTPKNDKRRRPPGRLRGGSRRWKKPFTNIRGLGVNRIGSCLFLQSKNIGSDFLRTDKKQVDLTDWFCSGGDPGYPLNTRIT
jgi:hypothetical protein